MKITDLKAEILREKPLYDPLQTVIIMQAKCAIDGVSHKWYSEASCDWDDELARYKAINLAFSNFILKILEDKNGS